VILWNLIVPFRNLIAFDPKLILLKEIKEVIIPKPNKLEEFTIFSFQFSMNFQLLPAV